MKVFRLLPDAERAAFKVKILKMYKKIAKIPGTIVGKSESIGNELGLSPRLVKDFIYAYRKATGVGQTEAGIRKVALHGLKLSHFNPHIDFHPWGELDPKAARRFEQRLKDQAIKKKERRGGNNVIPDSVAMYGFGQ